MGKREAVRAPPGSNWLALQKSLPTKRKSFLNQNKPAESAHADPPAFPRGAPAQPTTSQTSTSDSTIDEAAVEGSKEVKQLRMLVLGIGAAGETLVGEPGRYLALDCEMVGVGEDGKESSLARASMVDYHGRVVLDEFVQQRERVIDYRTQYSGIRPEDMVQARPFKEIQARVAALLAPADRVLVGHALSNDLSALLLTHPASRTRDTQLYAGRKTPGRAIKGKQNADVDHPAASLWDKYRTPRVALKRLAKEELGVDIQAGEHSSVTDARAAMAIYRLHKRAWDASLPVSHVKPLGGTGKPSPNGQEDEGSGTEQPSKRRKSEGESFPGGGRRGVSSGLSTIVRDGSFKSGTSKSGVQRSRPFQGTKSDKGKWWQTLGEGGGTGSKGQVRIA